MTELISPEYRLRLKNTEARLNEIFSNLEVRPEPRVLLDLILNLELSKEEIISFGEKIGYEPPQMNATLQEFKNALPYIIQSVATLVEKYPESTLYFLGRDAEILYDACNIMYPSRSSVLLAGSTLLFETNKQGDIATYLEKKGFNNEILNKSEPKAVLVDTGYRGSIGFLIRKALSNQYHLDYSEMKQRLPMELISAIYVSTHGSQLMNYSYGQEVFSTDLFPRVSSVVGEKFYIGEDQKYGYDRFAYRLAMSLQLLPHFHDVYSSLKNVNNDMLAIPKPTSKVDVNIDAVPISEDSNGGINASIVNPVAAVIIQHALISHLLNENKKKVLTSLASP